MSISPTSKNAAACALWPLITPSTDAQLWTYHALRWRMLRQPWNQPPDSSDEAAENASDHIAILDPNGVAVACGRVQGTGPGQAQLRSMAVDTAYQGRGLGLRIFQRALALARGRGVATLRIHARHNALEFYRRAGCVETGPGQTLFDQIPHSWMEKSLHCADFSRHGLHRRSAINSDGPAVAALVFGVLADYGMQPERDGIDRDLQDLQATYASGFFDVLHDAQGTLRATVAVLRTGPHSGELRRMYMAPELKGLGVGRDLLGHALAWSRAQGLTELELETASALHEALGLYRWAGFNPAPGDCSARRCDQRLWIKDF